MTPLLLASSAMAAGLSGLAVPEPLGAFGGPSAEGAPALATNPAASAVSTPELLVDLGVMATRLRYQLDGHEPMDSRGLSPVPSLSGALPLGRAGIGLAVFVPHARGGEAPPESSGAQLYAGDSDIMLVEGDLSAGVRLGPWRLGAALRAGHARVSSALKYDTGVLLTDILGPEAGVPLQDPFLQGTQRYDMRGLVWGGAFGARLRPERGPGLDLAIRTPLRGQLSGPFSLRPSDDLEMQVEGDATLPTTWPLELLLAGTWARGAWRPGAELSYTRWSSMYRFETALSDLQVSSDDPLFQALLDSYGLTEADFLAGVEDVPIETGLSDILAGGLWVDWLGEGAMARAGLWITPAAIPDAYVNPGNADFGTADLRLAYARRVGPTLLGLSVDAFLGPERVVEDSAYDQARGPHSGVALPPAHGRYALSAVRVGLTAALRGEDAEHLW